MRGGIPLWSQWLARVSSSSATRSMSTNSIHGSWTNTISTYSQSTQLARLRDDLDCVSGVKLYVKLQLQPRWFTLQTWICHIQLSFKSRVFDLFLNKLSHYIPTAYSQDYLYDKVLHCNVMYAVNQSLQLKYNSCKNCAKPSDNNASKLKHLNVKCTCDSVTDC